MSGAEPCPYCGEPMTPGGVAIACGPRGQSVRIALPASCTRPECRRDRDAATMRDAIKRGVIDP